MQTPLCAAERIALATLLVLATATCTDQPTEPGGGHAAQVRFTPVFSSNVFFSGLPLDNITVTVVRAPAETLVVKNAPFALTDSVLQLDVPVTLNAPSESLEVTLDLLSGLSLLFRGRDTMLVTAGTGGATAPAIAMTYVGPGANIAFLNIAPRDTVLSFGDTLTYRATAEDPQENVVNTFYLRWYTSPAGVPIRSDGRLIAPNSRSTVMVHAWTPSGEEDSTTVQFMPVPTQVLKVGGDLQSDTVRQQLPLPFVVEVRAADDLPVVGVPVVFAGVTANDSLVVIQGITDLNGQATAQGFLGLTAGSYSWTATVAGIAPVTFSATANTGPAATIAIVSGSAQSDTAGQALTLPFVVRVADEGDNPVAGATVVWTRISGSGTPAIDTVLTDGSGHAQLAYTLGGAGTDSIRATLAGTGASVDFTATASVGAVKVVVISGDLQTDTVTHLLSAPLVIETQGVGGSTPVPGVQVTWVVNVGSGVLSADTTVTDSLGRSAVTLTFGTVAGDVEALVDAHLGGALGVFHFTAAAAAPHHLAFVVAPHDSVQVGVALTPAPKVEVRDTFQNPVKVAGRVVYFTTSSASGAPRPPSGARMSASKGVIQFAGFPGGVDSALTDTAGVARFDSATVVGNTSFETLQFNSVGLPTLSQLVFLRPGLPNSVIPFAGTGQSVFADSLVPVAPQAYVVDTAGNGVPGVTVAFVVTGGGGSVTGDTVITDSLGYATIGSWRMGPVPGVNTLEARVAGVGPGVFTANGQPPVPTISLALLSTNVVGVGRTATLKVTLSSPDTAGVFVLISDLNPGVVAIDSNSATFGPVDTTRFRVLSGVSAGTADFIASAPGYLPDTITVTGSLNLITLPTTQNVAFGQTASLPVQLALPAPAGGVVVNITSLDPSKVSVVTPTVSFAVGEQLKNATVSGVALGSAQVVADNPNFAPDTSLVSTTASLNVVVTTLATFSTLPQTLSVEFRSGGALVPAPAGGIEYTPSPVDAGCVGTPAFDTIPAGQVSTVLAVGWGGVTPLPCTSKLYLTAPGMDPDSVTVTVNPAPLLTLSSAIVGAGLQINGSLTLQTGNHGGRIVTLKVLQSGIGLVSQAVDSAGADSISFLIPNGTSSVGWYAQGLPGILEDTVLVEASMPGFTPDTTTMVVRRAAFELTSVGTPTTTLSSDDPIWVNVGIPNVAGTFMQQFQNVRTGGTPLSVTFSISDTSIARLRDSSALADITKIALIKPGASNTPTTTATGGVAVDPVGPGLAVVSASIPGLLGLNPTDSVTVSAPTISVSTATVGAGLQVLTSATLGATAHGGVTVTLRLLAPGIAYLSPNDTTPGVDSSIAVVIPNGQGSISYYVQGVDTIVGDSVGIEISAPGFVTDTAKAVVRRAAFDLTSVPATLTSLSPNDAIWVNIGLPNVGNTFMQQFQNVRAGGTPLTATFTVTPSAAATLADSSALEDTVKFAKINARQSNTPTSVGTGGVAIDPLGPGTLFVTVNIPQLVGLNQSDTVAISAPVVTATGVTVGAGLQVNASATLGAPSVGVTTATIRLVTPGVGLVSPNTATPGTDSIQVPVPNGQSTISYVVQGVEGVIADSVDVVISASGYVTGTARIHVIRPALELAGVTTATTLLSPDDAFWANIGIPNAGGTFMQQFQNVRAGSPGITIAFVSSLPTVAQLVNAGGPVLDTAFATILAGQSNTPTTVGTGGVALRALTTGSTTVSASQPSFLILSGGSAVVTVSTPGITVNAPSVGSGLQVAGSFTLGASNHPPVDVIVKSSLPGTVLVSPNSTTAGTDSIIVHIPNGQSSGNFFLQGVEDSIGTPSILVQAVGFTDGIGATSVVQPAVELAGLPTTLTSGAVNDAFWANVGIPNAGHTFMQQFQSRRAGGTFLTATFVSGTPATGLIADSTGSGISRTATIPAQGSNTPTTVATGGVAFDPVAVGTSVVGVTIPGFFSLPTASQVVTVTP